MLSLVFFALATAVAFFLIPVHLLRRDGYARARDFFVAPEALEGKVTQNASIAGSLRTAMFVPLFAWGASGEFWPAIVAAVALGLGLDEAALLDGVRGSQAIYQREQGAGGRKARDLDRQ